MVIQFEDVTYKFSGDSPKIFHSINWISSSPEIVGLLGENGSGKSTFLRLLAGILKTNSGKITLDGCVIKGISSVKDQICYVPENAKLFLLGPTLKADLHRVVKSNENVDSLLNTSGLVHLAEKKLYALSEGQRRLSAIWLAFQLNRQIILLDEPTIGMDLQGKELFNKMLRNAVKNGKTVIIASNDSRILPLFDRITVIESGQLKLDGTANDVLYELEKATRLIPNQVVRLITKLNEDGLNIPHFTDIKKFNQYLKSNTGRGF